MKTLDQIKPKNSDVKWRNNILSPEMPKDNSWYSFRVVGGVLSYAQHWVKSINQKTGKEIVFPVDCLAWDDDSEDINRSKIGDCPGCQTDIKPRGKYLFNVIDRGVQKTGSSSYIRAFDLPPTAMNKILELSTLNMVNGQPKSVADVLYGCDLYIQWSTKEGRTGKGDWVIQKGERTPLTDEEKRAELYDFTEIYVPGDATNARQSLIRAGYFKEDTGSAQQRQVMMPPSGAQMPPTHNPPAVISQTNETYVNPPVEEQTISVMPKSLGKPPQSLGVVEKPSCFGAFKGDLDCPKCPHRPACLVLTQERQDG
jgi:hypothetical protein